jgi:hypothetical protein
MGRRIKSAGTSLVLLKVVENQSAGTSLVLLKVVENQLRAPFGQELMDFFF